MGRLRRFWSLTRPEKHYLCEAAILLPLANLCVRTIAFRHIDRFLRARWKDVPKEATDCVEDIRLVELSIARTANLFPWKSQCLCRSIAAYIMLRRRNVPAAIVAGVRVSEDSSLRAHAWLRTGQGSSSGTPDNAGFTALVRIGHEPIDG